MPYVFNLTCLDDTFARLNHTFYAIHEVAIRPKHFFGNDVRTFPDALLKGAIKKHNLSSLKFGGQHGVSAQGVTDGQQRG